MTNTANQVSSAAIVSLTVPAGTPIANAQTINVAFNTDAVLTLSGSDPDLPPLPLTFNVASSPRHGTLSNLDFVER